MVLHGWCYIDVVVCMVIHTWLCMYVGTSMWIHGRGMGNRGLRLLGKLVVCRSLKFYSVLNFNTLCSAYYMVRESKGRIHWPSS